MTTRTLKQLGFTSLFIFALGALVVGCATKAWQGFPEPAQDSRLVWPQPPEPARLAFVTQIHDQEDLFQSAGFWHKVGELVGGKADTALVRPFAVAIHPGGGLLVADPGRPCVYFYDWTRQRTVTIGPRRKGGLPSPVGVAALADGRILVSDSRLGTVESFDVNGKSLGAFCAAGTLKRPAGIAVDGPRGLVYVIDVLAHAVKVFDAKGALVRTIGGPGEGPGQFNYPSHLALDGQGRLLVTDSLNFRIQTFDAEGKFVSTFGQLGDTPGHFSKPKGVATDGAGNIVVVEGLYDAVQFFTPRGELLLSVGGSGHGPGEFWLPAGLCFDPRENLLFVADSYNQRIQVFRLLGAAGAQKEPEPRRAAP